MKRFAASLLALALLASAGPASAADRAIKLRLDGRPVDRAGGVALLHNGVVYADVVALVKSFNGLLTFQGNAVQVSIGTTTARFTVGSRTMTIDQGAVTLPGQTFLRNGDIYVPLVPFVTLLAHAKVRVDQAAGRADIIVNADPLS
ncbi:MAG TPA: stalk domain-containing protein [Candidatus Elarobacter sp.]|nr:stalk domain-containing protein [Candidatus Elarobacter sp.]